MSTACVVVIGVLMALPVSGCRAGLERRDPDSGALGGDSAMPAESMVEALVGVSMGELRRRVDVARIQVAIECVEQRGFVLPESAVDALETLPSPPPIFGGNVDAIVRSRLGEPAGSVAVLSSDEDAAIQQCLVSTGTSFADPFGELDDWLDRAMEDLNARVAADQRFVRAAEAERSCIRDLGYPTGDSAQVANALMSDANRLIDEFQSNAISRSAMEQQLGGLVAQENALAPKVGACLKIRLDVEREISREVQQSAIDRNGAALEEIVKEVRVRLHDLGLDTPNTTN